MNFPKLENIKTILLVVLGMVCIALIMSTTCSMRKNSNYENNIKALTDSVAVLTLKNGDLMYEKQSLIIEKGEIESYLNITKKEYADLEKKLKAKIAYIAELEGSIHADTIIMNDTIIYASEDTTVNKFNYADNWIYIDGTTLFSKKYNKWNTTINTLTINAPLTVGLDDSYKIFVTSDNPHLIFTDIQGAYVGDKLVKNKRRGSFGVGVHLGVGVQYGIIHAAQNPLQGFDIGPYLGVGFDYHFTIF